MTIDEKYNNAVQMLWSYYDGKNDTLRITSLVLEENSFGGDFWDMICPRLQREGILKEYETFFRGHEYVNQRRADEIWGALIRLGNFQMSRDSGEGIFNHLFVHDRHSFKILDELRELEKNEPQLKKELDSLPRIHTFVVDGKKLDAAYKNIKTISGGNADHNADRKAPLSGRSITGKSPRPAIRLITKHPNDGDYFYQDKRIKVNKRTLYYDVFDILFLYSDQDGFLSYGQIENYLIAQKYPHIEGKEKRNKRIQNAILNEQQGFFRHAKIGGSIMKNKTPDGRPLVEAARGDGLQLNNPTLK